jgi:hypothetical protein
MSNPVARRENHVNFYNRYLLLLTDYTDEQVDRVCSNRWGVVGPEKGHISNAECGDWSGRDPEKGRMSVAGRGWWMLGEGHVAAG